MRTSEALAAVGSKQAPDGPSVRAVEAVAGWLSRKTSRRGFLVRAGVLGSALAVDPTGYLLRPGSAYASVCGPAASCSSGWTVFCATINGGANSCPPGSIAAGWWKSDGASLCGGRSRYIVDCNATCHCSTSSGRPGICAPSCWSCRCTCGPAGQCDQRRVCCNEFRYGQCNEQVRQVGSVHCRVVSCTPPWRWEKCSTSPATDNATVDHNSPMLPSAYTPITVRYIALGENGSLLRGTVGPEFAVTGGRAQRYQHGRMSWTSAGGARYTTFAISSRYLQLGAEAGVLGFPTSDPLAVTGGAASQFRHGRISWPSATGGARYTTFAISSRYVQLGAEAGVLGFPTSDPLAVTGGAASQFRHGRISWPGATGGARYTTFAISSRYVQLGAEAGVLGFPTSDPLAVTGGAASQFQHGRISWSAAHGAHYTRGPIADHYLSFGAEGGKFGMPVSDEVHQAPVRHSDFVNGFIEYNEVTHVVIDSFGTGSG